MKNSTGELSGGPGNLRTRARTAKFDRLGIVRNRMATTIRPNDENGKRLRGKISTGELLGGLGNLHRRARALTI